MILFEKYFPDFLGVGEANAPTSLFSPVSYAYVQQQPVDVVLLKTVITDDNKKLS